MTSCRKILRYINIKGNFSPLFFVGFMFPLTQATLMNMEVLHERHITLFKQEATTLELGLALKAWHCHDTRTKWAKDDGMTSADDET